MRLLLLTLLINTSFVKAASVYCSNGDCTGQDANSTIAFTNGDLNKTVMWVSAIADSILNVINPSGQQPRDANIFVRNQDSTKELNLSIGSTLQDISGGRVDVYTDIFDTIGIDVSSNNGANGKNSSVICAEQFRDRILGSSAASYWNSDSRTGLPTSSCVSADTEWMNNQFACPSGYTEQPNDTVTVTRISKKNKCVSSYTTNRCVSRTYDVTCKVNIKRKNCGNVPYSLQDNDAVYIQPMASDSYDNGLCSDYEEKILMGKHFAISTSDDSIYSGDDSLEIYSFKKTGTTFDITGRVTEKKRKELLDDDLNVCEYIATQATTVTASYNISHFNPDTNVTTYTKESGFGEITYHDDSRSSFYFPLPDNATNSKNSSITNSDYRIVLKPWLGMTSFASLKPWMGGVPDIKNCLGLDGSSLSDINCDRTPGPAFTVTYYIIDRYGMRSSYLTFTVPESYKSVQVCRNYNYHFVFNECGAFSCRDKNVFGSGTSCQTYRLVSLQGLPCPYADFYPANRDGTHYYGSCYVGGINNYGY